MVNVCEQMSSLLDSKVSGNRGKRCMSYFVAYILVLLVKVVLVKLLLGMMGFNFSFLAIFAAIALLYIGAFIIRSLLEIIFGK